MSAQRVMSDHASAAKLIRQELKKAFPLVKFSVTSESYSMGDSVNVSWTNGPNTDKVNEIVKKYQYGHFNGMEDIYENSNNRVDIPQTKFVQTRREITNNIWNECFEYSKQYFNDLSVANPVDLHTFFEVNHYRGSAAQYFGPYLRSMDLTHGFHTDSFLDVVNNRLRSGN